MPRLMSFSATIEAMRERRKTVTRRLGWANLKPGTILRAVEKVRGLKRGERVRDIGLIRVVSVRTELLWSILDQGSDEVRREGFDMEPSEFVSMFRAANQCGPWQKVQRIEFEHVT